MILLIFSLFAHFGEEESEEERSRQPPNLGSEMKIEEPLHVEPFPQFVWFVLIIQRRRGRCCHNLLLLQYR
jgi:hypothetical protein